MSDTKEVMRPSANYPQDIWGDRFLTLPFNNSLFESYTKQVEALKGTVKDMLMVPTTDPIEKMHLINSLCRLGVPYLFEDEIEEQLSHLFVILPELLDDNDYDLHTVALVFQVFRFNGFKLPCGVFSKFLDDDGKFKEELISNVKGMISLYDASHFRTHGEEILDEALSFTTKHLKSLANQSSTSPHLKGYIEKALFRPYHHGLQRLEARLYISFYERDESKNYVLLKLAKYEFNRVQLMLQRELTVLSRWYKVLDLKSKLPYARHRVVESMFYALGLFFEPCYGVARNMLAKHTCLLGFIDDSYEAYGLYEELQSFTDALQRFDSSAIDELPADNQKIVYQTIQFVMDETENLVQKEGRTYALSYIKNEIKRCAKAEQVECGWTHEGFYPTFEEYLENGAFSSLTFLSLTQILLGIEEADQSTYEWITNDNNKLPKALQISTRLYNDIATDEAEEKRGMVTGTACYMKQYKVSRDEAIEAFRAIIADKWKEVNEGCMRPTVVPKRFARVIFNYQRLLDVAYKYNDGYTKPEITFKKLITKVLIEPIPLE